MSNTVVLQKRNLSPKLLVVSGGRFKVYDIKNYMVIGRNTDDNTVDIDIPFEYVSRRHAVIGCDENGYFYADTGSTNGTFCGGRAIVRQSKLYLSDGMVLHIYDAFVRRESDFAAMIFMTDYPESFAENVIKLYGSTAEVKIGRNIGSSVALGDSTVSELHASFFAAQSGWAVTDHRSTNGVYINGERLTEPKYLHLGDCVRIANVYFVFLGDRILYQQLPAGGNVNRMQMPAGGAANISQSPAAYMQNGVNARQNLGGGYFNAPLEIHIEQRSVWVKARELMLLENIDITINSGEMVLILGGSGAGKTTFMNAVMGYEKAKGSIRHAGRDIYRDFEQMKFEIGFVPQQDLLRGSDTVYDTLKNAAEMKLPSSVNRAGREARVESVLNTLGLKRESRSLVSKISGGQRKRLSIAVEYISDPSLFFLDEPDSGLDGIMAKSLMKNLRDIANEGKIVMVITHSPDRVAELFDKVTVLAKNSDTNSGSLAFFGSVEEAKSFFGTDSLEGIVQRINRADEGGDDMSDYFIDKYKRMTGRG